MNPQEKAKDLIDSFAIKDINIVTHKNNIPSIMYGCMTYISAIDCAIIAVDEILTQTLIDTGYWQEVKQELIKLKNQ